jgi:hypothetical protein
MRGKTFFLQLYKYIYALFNDTVHLILHSFEQSYY